MKKTLEDLKSKHWWHPKTEFKKGYKPKWTKESREKAHFSHLGKKAYEMTEEIKKKISLSHKDIKEHSGRFKIGHIGYGKGKKQSKELVKKRTHNLIGRKRPEITGVKNPNWRGGINPINDTIRKSIEYRFWLEGNLARDNYTCQKCRQYGGKLRIHHIQNFSQYPKLRFALDNGITFCDKCHRKFHQQYGIKNNNFLEINEFLSRAKMAEKIN